MPRLPASGGWHGSPDPWIQAAPANSRLASGAARSFSPHEPRSLMMPRADHIFILLVAPAGLSTT